MKGNSVTTHLQTAKAATLALGGEIGSPWDNEEENDDDDGFGDWSVPEELKVADGGFQPDEGWHRNAGVQGELGDHARDLAPSWRVNTTLSDPPKLAPSPMPNHSMRQPSPDPWATEFSRNDIPHTDEEGSSEVSKERLAKLEKEGLATKETTLLENGAQSGPQVFAQAHNIEANDISPPEVESIQSTESKRNSTVEADRSSSQPSSSPSVTSQHEDGRHESPRTSMEDDTNRPQMSRKVSSTIQELVETFDGLVQRNGDPESTSHETSQVRSQEQGLEQGIDDFGDVTDSKEEISDVEDVPDQNITISASPNSTKHISSPVTEPLIPRTPVTPRKVTSPNQTPQKFHGPVDVDVDLSILDELFPLYKPQPVKDVFIRDAIPHDSFCSTEERKMWYRISRYGPILKHNSGNDENYVRVSWPKSTVRDDTLKIVARWMEEDRLSGHVVLGGGGKTSALFGWGDSKAPAVSLASAFASKDLRKTQNPFSIQATASNIINPISPLHQSRQRAEKAPSMPEEVKPIPISPPVVNFGWHSVPENVPQRSIHIPTSPGLATNTQPLPTPQTLPTRISTSSLRPLVLSETIVPIESPQQTPVPVSASFSEVSADRLEPIAKLTDKIDNEEDDDDDDWGDMVSTPNTTTFEIIPLPNGQFSEESMITQTIPDATYSTPRNQALGKDQTSKPKIVKRGDLRPSVLAIPPSAVSEPSNRPSTLGDPWASADLSFLPSSTARLPASAPPSSPAISKPPPQKSVSFSTLPPQTLQTPLPRIAASRPNLKATEELVQEELVQSIIKGLPDLSYMLRK